MSEYYKVVRLFEDGVRGSAIVARDCNLFHEYVPSTWVHARPNALKFGLFVFTSCKAALEFAHTMGAGSNIVYEIWRVDAEGVRPLPMADTLSDNPSQRMVDALIMRECVRRVPRGYCDKTFV
jgi:hypothetical protein